MNKTYAECKPSEAGRGKVCEIREAFSKLHDLVEEHAPNTRERSVALTSLETAAMWAVKAVVHDDPESEPETDAAKADKLPPPHQKRHARS